MTSKAQYILAKLELLSVEMSQNFIRRKSFYLNMNLLDGQVRCSYGEINIGTQLD